tara:strand:+ start:5289 stop:5765 length:477 start_codon:yes stop_codon:yes gene_type:complete
MSTKSVTFTNTMGMSDSMSIVESYLTEYLKSGNISFVGCEQISRAIQTLNKIFETQEEEISNIQTDLENKTKFIEEYKSLIINKNKTIIESAQENDQLKNLLNEKSQTLDKSVEEIRRLQDEVEELKKDLLELCEEDPVPAPVQEPVTKKSRKKKVSN